MSKKIRFLIEFTILVFIWKNAHWSVAMFCTLISLRFWLVDYIKPRLRDARQEAIKHE